MAASAETAEEKEAAMKVPNYGGWAGTTFWDDIPKDIEGVYWVQATPSDGVARWRCLCGAEGDSFSIAIARISYYWHRRKHRSQ